MSTNSECSNLCCPNYNVVGAGAPNVSGNNMAPQYRVTAGQYEILTHRVDPVRAGFMDRTPVQLSPGEMGSCGYNSIVSAYGRNANCCSTPYKPMGCCPGPAPGSSSWGYCHNPNKRQKPINQRM
jgi:hypothetical protein